MEEKQKIKQEWEALQTELVKTDAQLYRLEKIRPTIVQRIAQLEEEFKILESGEVKEVKETKEVKEDKKKK